MNNCIWCDKLTKTSNNLCTNCRFDKTIMISLTETCNKYKITESEINAANLFKITFTVHHNYGTKYLRKDVHRLADKLTKEMPSIDKRRAAFIKQNDLVTQLDDNRNNIIQRKKIITDTINNLVIKYNNEFQVNDHIDIIQAIEVYADNISISPFVASTTILEKVKAKIDLIVAMEKRKTEIDNIINSMDKTDRTIAVRSDIYKQFVTDVTLMGSVNKCINKLELHIKATHEMRARKNKMNQWIKKTIDDNYWDYAKNSNIYNKFVEKGDINEINDIKSNLFAIIEIQKQKDQKIENFKRKTYEYSNSSDYDLYYTKYINNDISLDDVISIFEKEHLYIKLTYNTRDKSICSKYLSIYMNDIMSLKDAVAAAINEDTKQFRIEKGLYNINSKVHSKNDKLMIKQLSWYKEFENGNMPLDILNNILNKYCDTRKKVINYIINNYGEKYICLIKDAPCYIDYLKEKITFDILCNKMNHLVNLLKADPIGFQYDQYDKWRSLVDNNQLCTYFDSYIAKRIDCVLFSFIHNESQKKLCFSEYGEKAEDHIRFRCKKLQLRYEDINENEINTIMIIK